MVIKVELNEALTDDEIVIHCRQLTKDIQKIQQAIADICVSTKRLTFFKDNNEYYLSLDTILFFETSDNKINAHTIDDVYIIKYRLYELEDILPNNFLRISKSTIINVNKVYSICRGITSPSTIKFLNSHKQVYVSRFYIKNLNVRLEERRNYEI